LLKDPPTASNPLEVFQDGHLIFFHGYGGSGPLLECIEALGDHLRGSHVRILEVDLTCAQLLAHTGIASLEAERATQKSLLVLESCGVRALVHTIIEDQSDGLESYQSPYLRLSVDCRKLTWLS